MDNNGISTFAVEEEAEVLFENIHVRDGKFFKEFYSFTFFKRPLLIALYVSMVLSVITNVVSFIMGTRERLVWTIGPILWFLLIFFIYKRNVSVGLKRQMEDGNGKLIVYTVKVLEDRILYKTSLGTEMTFELQKIKRVNCTKSYLLLQTFAYQMIPVQKDCFTKGSYEDFCEFLRAKGYKVKG
ncbi:MAG: YcxB family protein [Ruminococcaceae bacterium]|nr:YcxB family protein [Oscillospiraceae bacterium]